MDGYIAQRVYEFSGSAKGGEYTATRESSQKMFYNFYGDDRTKGTADDLYAYNIFDFAGRTICRYTLDHEGNIVGASAASYNKSEGTSKANNKITSSAAVGIQGQNLLRDSGLEYHRAIITARAIP